MMRRMIQGAAGAAALALSLAGPAPAGEITIFAAASLKTALDKIATDWQTNHKGDTITISYAGSPQLAKQIEAGAPADIFISAAPEWMNTLEKGGQIEATSRRDLLGNSLVLVAPTSGDKAPVALAKGSTALADRLGKDGRLAMALVDSVPAGVYGREALTSLGMWDGVSDRLAQAENVRAALALVARAEAPLGIVYATDAHAEPGVATVATFPADSHAPITYPAALVVQPGKGSGRDAAAFLDALSAEPARGVFEAEGFTVAAPAPALPAPTTTPVTQ